VCTQVGRVSGIHDWSRWALGNERDVRRKMMLKEVPSMPPASRK
jgi:hypothetical protein